MEKTNDEVTYPYAPDYGVPPEALLVAFLEERRLTPQDLFHDMFCFEMEKTAALLESVLQMPKFDDSYAKRVVCGKVRSRTQHSD